MRPDQPWSSMDNIDILKSAGMYLKDQNTGKQVITLSGILIFGSELMIQTALPHYRTDAILRRENLDRYDIRVNLLRSYERLMQFIVKHLNDKFYLEGTQRISIRDKIFWEAITNMIVNMLVNMLVNMPVNKVRQKILHRKYWNFVKSLKQEQRYRNFWISRVEVILAKKYLIH